MQFSFWKSLSTKLTSRYVLAILSIKFLEFELSSYKIPQRSCHILNASSFQIRIKLLSSKKLFYKILIFFTFHDIKLIGSTTVGCIISFPGKTPHVTALGLTVLQLVRFISSDLFVIW